MARGPSSVECHDFGADASELARRLNPPAGILPWLRCAECGAISEQSARVAVLCAGERGIEDTPEVFFYCAECAQTEFCGFPIASMNVHTHARPSIG